MRRFWPLQESAQADYEMLRSHALAGIGSTNIDAARFARFGLAGLIARPTSEAILVATLVGARRPAWSPHVDSRQEALADGYELLLSNLCELGLDLKEAQP